jgi:hypothetical protein
MQDAMLTKSKQLIAADNFQAGEKTSHEGSDAQAERKLTLADLAAHKQKILSKKVLILVILINLAVLVSIILCA